MFKNILRTYGEVSGDAYVYSFDSGTWTSYPDQFTDDEHKYMTSVTLPLKGMSADGETFAYALAIDGANPDVAGGNPDMVEENERYYGIRYYLDSSGAPVAESGQWSQYAYPSNADDTLQRNFPAAMWVSIDKVCLPTM